jgi:hypothetical protein
MQHNLLRTFGTLVGPCPTNCAVLLQVDYSERNGTIFTLLEAEDARCPLVIMHFEFLDSCTTRAWNVFMIVNVVLMAGAFAINNVTQRTSNIVTQAEGSVGVDVIMRY